MENMNNLTAVFLTGGDSGRFWPLREKSSLNFFGISLIEHKIKGLIDQGVKNFVIVANNRNAQYCKNLAGLYKSINLSVVVQKSDLGMAGALISATSLIRNKSILILCPTDVFQDDVVANFLNSLDSRTEAKVLGLRTKDNFLGSYLIEEDDIVKSIVEKPDPAKRPGNLVKMVFDYFKSSNNLLDILPQLPTLTDDIYERALQTLIINGTKVNIMTFKDSWAYIKYPWHVLSMMDFFLKKLNSKQIKTKKIDKSVVIRGNVWIEEDVEIAENTVILGPTYIGKRTRIGNNVLIRKSMIGNDCMVGFSTEIARSFIGSGCFFHNNYIGDSVLSENIYFGAGAVTANFRLDGKVVRSEVDKAIIDTDRIKLGSVIGKGSKIGVNVSLAPGIKIGENTFINSGLCIDEDIGDNKFVTTNIKSYKVLNNKEV